MDLSFELFLKIFEEGNQIDETVFFFADDEKETEHYLGYLQSGPIPGKPYWAGYCDYPDGFECATAEELLNAPIFDGKSIFDRWDNVRVCRIGGIPIDLWLKRYI